MTYTQNQETIYNVFAYGDEETVTSIGVRKRKACGSYKELTELLRHSVATDFSLARQIDFDGPEQRAVFEFATRIGALEQITPSLVEIVGDSICCITHVIDGVPRADQIVHAPPHDAMPDYLNMYWKPQGFDFTELIEDDYYSAIKVLWNEKKYISSLKLTCSLVDTLGYVEFGDNGIVFVRWLDAFCDFTTMGSTPEEFWELRNSLLHMSNLESRQVQKGRVKRLIPVLHPADQEFPIGSTADYGFFHMARFLADVFPKGIANWVGSYSGNNQKLLTFTKRYDTIVSEARMMRAERSEDM